MEISGNAWDEGLTRQHLLRGALDGLRFWGSMKHQLQAALAKMEDSPQKSVSGTWALELVTQQHKECQDFAEKLTALMRTLGDDVEVVYGQIGEASQPKGEAVDVVNAAGSDGGGSGQD
jgi:hypothetical protein